MNRNDVISALVDFQIPPISHAPYPIGAPNSHGEQEAHDRTISAHDDARARLRVELSALDDADLARRYAGERKLRMERLEPIKSVSRWIARDEWTWTDAAHILNGLEPRAHTEFQPTDSRTQPEGSDRWRVAELYDLIKGAYRQDKLKSDLPPFQPDGTQPYKLYRVTPQAVVIWAKAKTDVLSWLRIPDAFATLGASAAESVLAHPVISKTANQLAHIFRCPIRGHVHKGLDAEECWQGLARNAKDSGLDDPSIRIKPGTGAGNPSQFSLEGIAKWLIKRGRPESVTADELLQAIPEGAQFDAMRKTWTK